MEWLKDGFGKFFKKEDPSLTIEDEQQKQRSIRKLYTRVQRGIRLKFLSAKNSIKERVQG